MTTRVHARGARRATVLVAAACVALSGPATAQWFGKKSEKDLTREADAYIASKPEPLKPFFHTLYMEGEWNSVLNFNLLALAALELRQLDLATKALDQSTARILRIYADDPNAQKARSLWSAEGVKDFKGEPYERAAAFLYRGLLYIAEGDLQNARAAFLQADIQNSLGQTEQYDRSFALPVYLAAWASRCDGDAARAEDLLRQARKSAVDPFIASHGDALPTHLTLIERGLGPEKVTLGDMKSILGFLPQPDISGTVQVVYENAPPAPPASGIAGSVDWLALTRGGRPIQGILDGKASFKQTTGTIAEVSGQIAQGLYQSLSQMGPDKLSVAKNMANLGLATSVIGMVAGMASKSANAEADTRYWGSLPKAWHLEAFDAPKPVVAKALKTSHAPAPRPVLLTLPSHPRCSFAFAREFSALDATSGGVGNPSPWPAEPMESDRVKVNEDFRNFLRSAL